MKENERKFQYKKKPITKPLTCKKITGIKKVISTIENSLLLLNKLTLTNLNNRIL